MPGWNLVERQSCADDGEPVLLAQAGTVGGFGKGI